MPNFAEIQDEISAMLDIPDEDLTDEQRRAMEQYLDELGAAEAAKVDGFARFIRLESGYVETIKKESQRLAAKAKSMENRINYLKARYSGTMQGKGINKITGNAYTLSLLPAESVAVTALIDTLPPEYIRETISREPDKKAIKADLKAGKAITGCALVTTFSLQIK